MHTLDRFARQHTPSTPASSPAGSPAGSPTGSPALSPALPPTPVHGQPSLDAGAFDEPVFLPLPRVPAPPRTADDGWSPPGPPAPAPPASRPPRPGGASARLVVAAVCAAALAGAGAGYLTASLHNDASPESSVSVAPMVMASGSIDVPAVAAAIEPSVVTITAEVAVRQGPRSATAPAAGTGIVLTADGEILTNAHVVAGATSVTVTLAGDTAGHTAIVVGIDEANDIALLKVQGVGGLTPAVIGDSEQVIVGEDVVAVGNALDLEGEMLVTVGIISALNRTVQVDGTQISGMLQTDTAISSGNSGGPLVNAVGEVIGVVTAGATSSRTVTAENIGFAITINRAMQIVADMRS